MSNPVNDVRHGEEPARRRAVADLGGSGRPEAIAPLLVAVGDESWAVRQAAVEALAGFPPEALLPALEAALRDGDDAGSRNAAMEIYVDLKDFIDKEAEIAKIEQQIPKLEGVIKSKEGKLSNESFTARAPAEVVAKERESLKQMQEQLDSTRAALSELRKTKK